jgi:DNA invertase Pin-like site-specific DNA recombinase
VSQFFVPEKQALACVKNQGQNDGMKIGYCRVSTDDQNPDLQLTALQRAGCTRIFTDKATGVHVKRPQLTKCLASLEAGDVLVVWKLDRLGRSLRDLIALLDDLKAREVAFRSLTEALDTTTPTGRAMWQMVGILAELERSLIQERTTAGRAAAIARGVKMGRKPLLSAPQVAHARQLLAQGERPVHVAHLLNVSRRTLERAVSRGGA